MIAISTTELRKNLRKYLEMATREKVVVRFNKSETVEIVPGKNIESNDEYFSNPKLLEALREAEEDIAAGRVREVKDVKQLWEGIQ
jgi:PHD/YefM family antitoxin component YafN of YafNO toxin-antitoxin module